MNRSRVNNKRSTQRSRFIGGTVRKRVPDWYRFKKWTREKERREREKETHTFEANAHFYADALGGNGLRVIWIRCIRARWERIYVHPGWRDWNFRALVKRRARDSRTISSVHAHGEKSFRKLKRGGTYALNWWLVIKVAVSVARPGNYLSLKKVFMRVRCHSKVLHDKDASYENIYDIQDEWEEILFLLFLSIGWNTGRVRAALACFRIVPDIATDEMQTLTWTFYHMFKRL